MIARIDISGWYNSEILPPKARKLPQSGAIERAHIAHDFGRYLWLQCGSVSMNSELRWKWAGKDPESLFEETIFFLVQTL